MTKKGGEEKRSDFSRVPMMNEDELLADQLRDRSAKREVGNRNWGIAAFAICVCGTLLAVFATYAGAVISACKVPSTDTGNPSLSSSQYIGIHPMAFRSAEVDIVDRKTSHGGVMRTSDEDIVDSASASRLPRIPRKGVSFPDAETRVIRASTLFSIKKLNDLEHSMIKFRKLCHLIRYSNHLALYKNTRPSAQETGVLRSLEARYVSLKMEYDAKGLRFDKGFYEHSTQPRQKSSDELKTEAMHESLVPAVTHSSFLPSQDSMSREEFDRRAITLRTISERMVNHCNSAMEVVRPATVLANFSDLLVKKSASLKASVKKPHSSRPTRRAKELFTSLVDILDVLADGTYHRSDTISRFGIDRALDGLPSLTKEHTPGLEDILVSPVDEAEAGRALLLKAQAEGISVGAFKVLFLELEKLVNAVKTTLDLTVTLWQNDFIECRDGAIETLIVGHVGDLPCVEQKALPECSDETEPISGAANATKYELCIDSQNHSQPYRCLQPKLVCLKPEEIRSRESQEPGTICSAVKAQKIGCCDSRRTPTTLCKPSAYGIELLLAGVRNPH